MAPHDGGGGGALRSCASSHCCSITSPEYPPPAEHRSHSPADGGSVAVYRTKVINFLGRSTPILLQNENSPCALLAICNVLLLRGAIHLGEPASDVSHTHLLSLLAEKIMDCIWDAEGKDEDITNALNVLPLLVNGLNVNLKFTKIDDFERTKEFAVFKILNIGLYHGWLIDSKDIQTATAIGSQSYNRIVGDMLALDTGITDGEDNGGIVIDLADSTCLTLRDPSPRFSGGGSCDDCPDLAVVDRLGKGAGDREELQQVMKAITMSISDITIPVIMPGASDLDCRRSSPSSDTAEDTPSPESLFSSESSMVKIRDEDDKSHRPEMSKTPENDTQPVTVVIGSSSSEGSERMYEGEDCMSSSGQGGFEDEQANKTKEIGYSTTSIIQQKGQLIKRFFENSASQLTLYGLLSLQGGLKERDLCILFRNNHFSTMFKFNGEIYLLATDEGYLDSPDFVWEKLNEVNGNTIFANNNFAEIKNEYKFNDWDDESFMDSTSDDQTKFEGSLLSTPSASDRKPNGSREFEKAKGNIFHMTGKLPQSKADIQFKDLCNEKCTSSTAHLHSFTTIVVLLVLSEWYIGTDMHRGERTVQELDSDSESESIYDTGLKCFFICGGRVAAAISGDIDDGLKVCKIIDEFVTGKDGYATRATHASAHKFQGCRNGCRTIAITFDSLIGLT